MGMQKEYNQCQKSVRCGDCPSNHFCMAWVDYVKKHEEIKPYAHFDKRVSLKMPSIRKYVMNPQNIKKHSFYPFIHFQKRNSRYGKKGPKEPRELYYCSHLDRCVYQRYAFLINYQYNTWAHDNGINDVAIAYRNTLGKNNIDFAKYAFDMVRSFPKCFVLVGDFTKFFDKLDHSYLKSMLCKVLCVERLPEDYFAVFKNISRFSSWDWAQLVAVAGENICEPGIRTKLNKKETIITKEQFENNKQEITKNKTKVGIPQGSPISAVLSNIYMIEFDGYMKEYTTNRGGTYMRYSDDFIIVLPFINKEEVKCYIDGIFSYVKSMEGLIDLQKEKTDCYIYENNVVYSYTKGKPDSISYLGFIFDGNNIRLRPKAITKYYYRMRRKAHTIGRHHWKSPKGRHVSAKNLYSIYSKNNERQTFIDYAKKAKSILKLNDRETDALIKRHKEKIALAIKEGEKPRSVLKKNK